MESGPGRSKDNCSHQLNFLEGVTIPLYGNRAAKSFELVWFLLHACLVLVLTEFHLVCFCRCCVRVWEPRVRLDLFVLPPWFFFSCCLHVGFLFGDKRRACACG